MKSSVNSRSWRSVFFCVTLLAANAAFADAVETIKAMELPWGTEALKVDGDFSDWGKMAWRDDFLSLDRQPQRKVKCRFALKRDRENLYVAWRADGKYRASKAHVRHDGDIWRGNSVVELFFNRPSSANGFVQFALAANGDRHDGADGDSFVTPDWECAARTDENGWQAEMRIPFRSIERENYKFRESIRMNVCMSIPEFGQAAVWSLDEGSGYRDVTDMGYVAIFGFSAASEWEIEGFEKAYGEKPSAQPVANGDDRGFVGFLAALEDERRARNRVRVRKITARLAALPDAPPVFVQSWDEDLAFGEKPVSKAGLLERALDVCGKSVSLCFEAAVNETTHRPFVLSAPKPLKDVSFVISDLHDGDKTLPASCLHVARFAFLHPPADIHRTGKELNLDYPEIVERVRTSLRFRAGESFLFRLYLDTRGVSAGNYVGKLDVRVDSEVVAEIDVAAHVCRLELPLPETHPFDAYLFTTIPWGGESADEWARFFRDHYMTDVSFEHPVGYLDGKSFDELNAAAADRSAPPKTRAEEFAAYAKWMTDRIPVPEAGRVRFDLSAYKMDERLRACAKYNLRAVISSRAGSLKSEYFPALMDALKTVGFGSENFIYKLGDEDDNLVYLPVAKRLRELVPGLRTMMIPSGTSYWDIKPAAEGFTDFTFSTAAYRGGEKVYDDIAFMQSKGVRISRYTNRPSWAGRTLPIQARRDPWDVLVVDGLNGYTCWTAGLRPNLDFQTGYSGYNKKYRIHELPPDRQIASMLVYVRKDGDIYHPVSCIRLENIRDGITDALYCKLVRERAEKTGDASLRDALKNVISKPLKTLADYDAARAELRTMLLK